ncbi:hypothetical protein [Rickettsia endosymbiont of Orchestes rusci]|uniref:hypothetical protein n=1 Tax=Rickettsia endosymbiont of Orchestes rusci TaxID=3066250 RepID=UPI00313D283A
MLKQVQHDKEKSGFPPLARMTSKIRAMQQSWLDHGMTPYSRHNPYSLLVTF